MAWSTRQLAEIADTSVKTVRYYHSLGLLDEPERMQNGYKRYDVEHLVRILHIRRLGELGVPLAQVAAITRPDGSAQEALRKVDAELATTLNRLDEVRSELGQLVEHDAPTDLPAGFDAVANALSPADRAVLFVSSRVLDGGAMNDLRALLHTERRTNRDAEFDLLAVGADPEQIDRMVEWMAAVIRARRHDLAWTVDPYTRSPRGAAFAESTMVETLLQLYNSAQIEVIRRASLLADLDSSPD